LCRTDIDAGAPPLNPVTEYRQPIPKTPRHHIGTEQRWNDHHRMAIAVRQGHRQISALTEAQQIHDERAGLSGEAVPGRRRDPSRFDRTCGCLHETAAVS
jgi:hypothetical protein